MPMDQMDLVRGFDGALAILTQPDTNATWKVKTEIPVAMLCPPCYQRLQSAPRKSSGGRKSVNRRSTMSDAFVTGQRLGDYEILGVLGAGGMGTVYKVRNVISDRIEAMKVLLANLADQKELADRFLREIKILASLD